MEAGAGATRRGYSRVVDSDAQQALSDVEIVARRQRERQQRIERLSTKLHALVWVVVAVITFIFARVYQTAFFDERVHRWLIYVGLAGVVANMGIMVYVTQWIPRVRGIRDIDWTIVAPNAVPTASAIGVGALVCFLIGFWPAYGLLTPLILGLIMLGSLLVFHFIPFC